MKNYLLVEPNLSGHHSVYLDNFVSGLIGAGNNIFLVLADTQEAKDYAEKRRDSIFRKSVEIVFVKPRGGFAFGGNIFLELMREFSFYLFFRHAFRVIAARHRIDMVFLPYIDYCLYMFGLLGSPFGRVPFEGIAMRPSFHFAQVGVEAPASKVSGVKRWLFERVLKLPSLNKIMVLDPTMNIIYDQNKYPLVYLPDPSSFDTPIDMNSAKHALGVDPGSFAILVYGSIDGRKGLDCLLDLLSTTEAFGPITVLLVGKQSEAVRAMIGQKSEGNSNRSWQIVSIDRRVADAEEAGAFSAADLVWVGYRGHYTMSGVLIKAAQYGRPVLAFQQGLIGWFVKNWDLGILLEERHFSRSFKNAGSFALSEKSVNYFRESHSWANAISVLLNQGRLYSGKGL